MGRAAHSYVSLCSLTVLAVCAALALAACGQDRPLPSDRWLSGPASGVYFDQFAELPRDRVAEFTSKRLPSAESLLSRTPLVELTRAQAMDLCGGALPTAKPACRWLLLRCVSFGRLQDCRVGRRGTEMWTLCGMLSHTTPSNLYHAPLVVAVDSLPSRLYLSVSVAE